MNATGHKCTFRRNIEQAETIKTRLEQQMDNLDVTDTHYDKKIVDLQRRLDAQYDRIDEVEETVHAGIY